MSTTTTNEASVHLKSSWYAASHPIHQEYMMPEINVRQRFNQAPEQVFAALGTHASLNQLFWPIQVVRTVDARDPAHLDGVGSIRRMGFGPIKPLAEQITAYQPHQMIEYILLGKSPVRDHIGRMTFTPDGNGTVVHYHISLNSAVPLVAPIVLSSLQWVIRIGLARMARTLV
jgi:uncharacterized protein YndB with AHSA1/START domain